MPKPKENKEIKKDDIYVAEPVIGKDGKVCDKCQTVDREDIE